jgi:hypothetical protein
MEEQPKAPSARDMSGNQYTGKELVKVSGKPPPMALNVGRREEPRRAALSEMAWWRGT